MTIEEEDRVIESSSVLSDIFNSDISRIDSIRTYYIAAAELAVTFNTQDIIDIFNRRLNTTTWQRIKASPARFDAVKSVIESTQSKSTPIDAAKEKLETHELVVLICDSILADERLFAMADTAEFYIYSNGVYVLDPADRRIERLIRDRIEKYYKGIGTVKTASVYIVNECKAYLISRSHVDRESIDAAWHSSNHINFKNGLFDISTWTLGPHDPGMLSINQFPVEYNSDAKCPAINDFLDSCELGNSNISMLAEFTGYCLTPDTRYEKALLLLGSGSNGKTVFLNLFKEILGRENFSTESLHSMGKPFRLANMYGKSANVYPDMKDSKVEDLEPFMASVGDDSILTAEKKYKNSFQFRPTAKTIVSANHAPPAHADNYAYFRRWLIIEFPKKFDSSNRDRDLLQKLVVESEKSGFLNMMLAGLKRLRANKQFTDEPEPELIARAYRMNSDPIAVFVEEKCGECRNDDEPTPKNSVFDRYVTWCTENRIEPKSLTAFSHRLKGLGYPPRATHFRDEPRVYYYENLRVLPVRQSIFRNIVVPDK